MMENMFWNIFKSTGNIDAYLVAKGIEHKQERENTYFNQGLQSYSEMETSYYNQDEMK